jgi:hypothetical protein
MTFEQASALTSSEKITLVTIESEKLVKLFAFYSANTYYKEVPFFVVDVKQNGISLDYVANKTLISSGNWTYEPETGKVYVNIVGDLDPKTTELSLVYRHFLSNAPLNLPYDLNSGTIVEWLPYVNSIGSVGQQLDDQNTGVALESNSTIDLLNDGFFDEIYDTHIFENKNVKFYLWYRNTAITESKKIFEGVIDSKDFSENKVVFRVKDFVYKLRNLVTQNLFTALDGRLQDSLIGTPKRRVYGQVKQMKLAGINNVLDGFTITGTVSVAGFSTSLVGVGTQFLKELTPGDEISVTWLGTTYKFGIELISSNTSATLNKASDLAILSVSAINNPQLPYRHLNRIWHIADHKLREPTTTISSIVANNRFILNSVEDLFADDQVLVNGSLVSIRRISSNEMVTENAISPVPSVGATVKKLPIQKVFFGPTELIYNRDWTYTNSTYSSITILPTAEFNVTQEKLAGVNITFTNGSSTVSTTATVDFRSILKPRDWIKKNSIVSGEGDWYEILDVKEQSIFLRANYTGTTATTTALIKSVTYVQDDSLMTCNCLGMEKDGLWIKTPSDAIRHLVLNDAKFPTVNEDSFTQAKFDCDYILSMVIPENLGSQSPQIRDVVTKINESVFGSLYVNSDNSVSYGILNSTKPETIETLTNDDIVTFSSNSKTEIFNNIVLNYRPFVDHNSGENAFEVISYNSGFVDSHVGIENTLTKTVYLFEDGKTEIIAQRLALFKSLANTNVTIRSKLNLFTKSVNDKVLILFDRLFKRYGGGDRRKIGIISSVKKSQYDVEIVVQDLGNIYNRVPSISPNTASEYSSADQDQKVQYAYVVDNDVLTPDPTSEENLGNNIIG